MKQKLMIENDYIAWHFECKDGKLVSMGFYNKLSNRNFVMSSAQEITLVFSADLDRVEQPYMSVSDFEICETKMIGYCYAVFQLHNHKTGISIIAHYQLDGPTRRKWVEIKNGKNDLLLLDVELDKFSIDALISGGGHGQPIFIADEAFCAVEHPAGMNQGDKGHIHLAHFPGKHLSAEERFCSHTALVSVTKTGQALEHFVSYIQEKSLRKKEMISVYTPFGINNQWGVCSTLDDEQTLDVLGVLEKWQNKGIKFDYFTLDTGWVDPNSDLTRFKPTGYPNGPDKIVKRVNELGMKFGLWFATSWSSESCWDYSPAWVNQHKPPMAYRNGYPDRANFSGSLCMASEPYVNILRNAVLHHIRENNVRFIKFDGGNYYCENVGHGHLPGKYSTEKMYNNLIEIANSARSIAPDIFVMWYWGLRSPFWALHGDSIFESGLHMEGSGTSSSPTMYYRDSVTLAQDQNAQFAKTIPPIVKDSLGVWFADTRWGNYMGKERWKESLVMDLGRGNMLFPNLWGNVYHLDDDDEGFLAWLSSVAKKNQSLFLKRHNILGDPWKNEVYGYCYFSELHGFIFINNANFSSRKVSLRLDSTIGIEAKSNISINILTHFPNRGQLLRDDGSQFKVGDVMDTWLRPFEVLMLEVIPSESVDKVLPIRSISEQQAKNLSTTLQLQTIPLHQKMDIQFSDAPRFEQQGYIKKSCAFDTKLPSLEGEQPILTITVKLRKGDAEWRYSPAVVEIVQILAYIDEQHIQLVPVPDARQFGNTQKAGCSWVIYKVRLNPKWSHRNLKLAVHYYVPKDVEAQIDAWVIKRWWREYTRPMGDGYYADAPS